MACTRLGSKQARTELIKKKVECKCHHCINLIMTENDDFVHARTFGSRPKASIVNYYDKVNQSISSK